jgi:hypothetical protein
VKNWVLMALVKGLSDKDTKQEVMSKVKENKKTTVYSLNPSSIPSSKFSQSVQFGSFHIHYGCKYSMVVSTVWL